MADLTKYVIDSDVLIQAHKLHYSFVLCPGFWDSLSHFHGHGIIRSVDKVREEIYRGKETDKLRAWAKDVAPKDFFAPTNNADVLSEYGSLMAWAGGFGFTHGALADFSAADNADAWIISYAKAHGLTVVTQEQHSPGAYKRVIIPNACEAVGVKCIDTWEMLETLGIAFKWTAPVA